MSRRSKLEISVASRKLFWLVLLFTLLTQVVTLLHKPNSFISGTQAPLCNFYITKLNIFHVHIDCDSQYFLLDSQSPSRLLSSESPLQDRPFHIFLVFVVAKMLNLLGIPFGGIMYLGEDQIPQTYFVLNYIVFILINAITLAFSVSLMLKVFLNSRRNAFIKDKLIVVLLAFLISQNPVTREYFWTPHSQVFNLLIPVILFVLLEQSFVMEKKKIAIYSVMLSIGLLVYPTFLILLPVLVLKTWQAFRKLWFLIPVGSLIPKIIWPILIEKLGGNYVDWPVVGHRRFVWILDSYQADTLARDLKANLIKFLFSMPLAWSLSLFIVCAIGLMQLKSIEQVKNLFSQQYLKNSLFAILIYAGGLFLNGEYGRRFTVGLMLLICFVVLNQLSVSRIRTRYQEFLIFLLIALNLGDWLID